MPALHSLKDTPLSVVQEVEVADLVALNPSLNTSNGAIYLGAWCPALLGS